MLLPQWADYPGQTDICLPCLWWVWRGGWEGLGLDMVQRYRPRGVWSSRWRRAAYRSGNLDAPVGIWAQAQSLVPGIGLSRGGRVRDPGYRPGSQVVGEEALLPGSHAVRAQAWRAGPGSEHEHLGSLQGPALLFLSHPSPRCSPCPFVSITCVWSTCCLSTLK